MKIVQYTNQSMLEIITELKDFLKYDDSIKIEALNPDICSGKYSGEVVELNSTRYIYRGYKAWVNLAEILYCRIKTPKIIDEYRVAITFEKLNTDSSFHTDENIDRSEKYGTESIFSRINKNEEPTFLNAYHKALLSVKINTRKNILNLGINRGDEFKLIEQMISVDEFSNIKLTGIDHSITAINEAKNRFPAHTFHATDINDIDSLNLGSFDLIISIGTLQSPSINYKPFLMNLVQNYLNHDGAIILGFPME
jgi:hypothetical protein